MKNWQPAESGCEERAIEITPRTCGFALNSAFTLYPGSPVPGMPLAPGFVFGQPPWTMKPLMIRWNAVLS